MIGNEAGLYGEGFDYDVLVSNSLLHSKAGVNTTKAPYTIFTGRRPSARLLCAFGCAGVYYAREKNKARPRGIPAIYVGANTRTGAFKLLERGEPLTQKIIETKNFVAELRSYIRNVYEGLAPEKMVDLYDNFPVFEDSQSINDFHQEIIRDVMAQPAPEPSVSSCLGKRPHDATVPRSRAARDEPALKARRIIVAPQGSEEPDSLLERGRRLNRTTVSLSQRKDMSVPAVERRVDGKYFAGKAKLQITIGDFSRIGGKGSARRVTFRRRPCVSSSSLSDDEDIAVEEPSSGVGAPEATDMEEQSSGAGADEATDMEEQSSGVDDVALPAADAGHSHGSGSVCHRNFGGDFFEEKLSPSRVAEYQNRGVRRASARQAERAAKDSDVGGRRSSVRQAEHRAKDKVMSCEDNTASIGVCFQFRDSGLCSRSTCKYAHVVSSPDPPLSPLWDVSVPFVAEDPPCPPPVEATVAKKVIILAAERLKRALDRLHLQRLRRERQLEFEVLNFMRNLEAESAGESMQELLLKVELGSNGPSIPKHFGEAMSSPYRSDQVTCNNASARNTPPKQLLSLCFQYFFLLLFFPRDFFCIYKKS